MATSSIHHWGRRMPRRIRQLGSAVKKPMRSLPTTGVVAGWEANDQCGSRPRHRRRNAPDVNPGRITRMDFIRVGRSDCRKLAVALQFKKFPKIRTVLMVHS